VPRLQLAGTKKSAQALAIGTREDIIMLDKAPNGKVSDLLDALDKALSAGEVERAMASLSPPDRRTPHRTLRHRHPHRHARVRGR
jgi:DNA recombination-dependent growth factor C